MQVTDLHIYKNPQALAVVLAEKVLNLLKDALIKNEDFHIAVSGGKTPQVLFSEIASRYKDPGHWHHVYLYWVDERCVPPDHPESNFNMINDSLLRYLTLSYQHIYRMKGEDDPYAEARQYQNLIRSNVPLMNSLPCFNLVILGVGTDGHTASIFPDQIALFDSENLCEVSIHPATGQRRITLTGKVINNAKNIYVLVTGKDKSTIVANLLNEKRDIRKYPAAYIKPTHGELEWFLDDAAAKHLTR